MPHSRTDIGEDDTALRCLSGCEYKVLHYLINRADEIGVSYPKQETIAEAVGYDVREVQRALEVLHMNAVIRYRRRNAFDPTTRRKLTNVYQVSPDVLAVVPDFEAEARSEWQSLINQCGNISTRLWSHNNQHQEPTPLTNSRTSSKNQHHQSAKADNAGDDYANQREGADSGGNKKTRRKNKTPTGSEASAPRETTSGQRPPKSSVPPAPRPQYANPDSINTNLPDAAHEKLANDLRQFGIGTPLARGFVAEYGYARVLAAYKSVQEMGDKARQPAAVFRSIVQIRLADDFALAQEQIFGRRRG